MPCVRLKPPHGSEVDQPTIAHCRLRSWPSVRSMPRAPCTSPAATTPPSCSSASRTWW